MQDANQAVLVPLFDASPNTEIVDAPRCRMCPRPARWNTAQQQWSMYCTAASCTNRERVCQQCGGPFVMNVDGAGTKYCSTKCKETGYSAGQRRRNVRHCAWCGRESSPGYKRVSRGGWPYICEECIAPIRHLIDRLKNHHVPAKMARRLIDDPGCEACGTDIVVKRKESGTGKYTAWLHVDHDHSCCPKESASCGQCIRGLICRYCNIAIGLLDDSADRARSLAAYLDSKKTIVAGQHGEIE